MLRARLCFGHRYAVRLAPMCDASSTRRCCVCCRGNWAATFYEDGRVEPKIYTLTGDLMKAITINPDNSFSLSASQVLAVYLLSRLQLSFASPVI